MVGKLLDGPPPAKAQAASGDEIVVGGRRYRLVPLDSKPAMPRAPSAAYEARKTPHRIEKLTAREIEIAALVARGLVNKRIAQELGISEWTVSTHLRRIFAKLGVETRAAMVSRCARASGDPDR